MMTHLKAWMAASVAVLGLVAGCASSSGQSNLEFPGKAPGAAKVLGDSTARFALGNRVVSVAWTVEGGKLVPGAVTDRLTGQVLPAPKEVFTLVFRNGRTLEASKMTVAGPVKETILEANPASSCTAEHFAGKQLSAVLESPDGLVRVDWTATLRDGSNYVRQQIVIRPVKEPADIAKIILVDHWLPKADIVGQVPGSPVVAGTLFTGFEHPMSKSQVQAGEGGGIRQAPVPNLDKGNAECEDDPLPADVLPLREGTGDHHAQCWLERALPLVVDKSFTCSSVIGIVPAGQLRRGFLHYVERERAHAYRTFLHYNSWYDIGYFTPFNEKDCLGSINAFATELGENRDVKMDSFLFDDGWDDTSKGGEWVFHSGFPNGFTPLKEAAAKAGAAPGVWLSPWGGYGKPREARVKSGKAAGYEAFGTGYNTLFALSGPKYYANFHRACTEMVTKYGINQFKLDGTGNINTVVEGSQFGSDFEAAITLIDDLRTVKPDLFINLTTGTWPSPFWLPICDSIWRGGEDHSFAKGPGSDRQRWITYRDADTYNRIVRGGPLYPLNSLMLHGIIYAKHAKNLDKDPNNDFAAEVRSYFGTGTQLQEMYISHGLLTKENWDVLAEASKWSRANSDTLVDTHWIGGSPDKLQVYGWAAWSPDKGILTLRNPSDKPQEFTIDLAKQLELPAKAPGIYKIYSPYKQELPTELLGRRDADKPVTITLNPFQVLVIEAIPQK
jgi:hypothetical protein